MKNLIEGGEPVVTVMMEQLRRSVSNAGEYFGRMDEARNTRFAVWPGQSPDARKHGAKAFPWDGASDTRIRAADEVVNEQVMLMLAAFWRQNIQAVGANEGARLNSTMITQLLKWTIYSKMLPHLYREIELAAQWRQESGLAILSIEWDQETRVDMETLDIEQLRAAMEQAPEELRPGLEDLDAILTDPLREADGLEMLQRYSPLVTASTGREILRDLREMGISERVPVATILTNQPRFKALRPFVDVFVRPEFDDIQREPWVARVEYLYEDELRDRIITQGYDEDFVEEACKHKGQFFQFGSAYVGRYSDRGSRQVIEDRRDQIELLHMYTRDAAEYGHPTLYYTVINDAVSKGQRTKDLVARHGVHGYEHGKQPFVALVREHVGRRATDSRGVSEIVRPWQEEIKIQRDTRSDYTQIATIPPLIIPPGRGGGDFAFGPGAEWPGRRGGNPEFANVPPANPMSISMEEATRRDMDRYFFRANEINPPALVQLGQQHLVQSWLLEMRVALQQMFQLMQQYMTTEEVGLITGVTDFQFTASREDIQGQWQFFIDFDIRSLDTEYIKEVLTAVKDIVLGMDRFGTVNTSQVVQYAMRALVPQLASIAITDPQQASENEVSDERQAFALMYSGQEAPMPLGNLNHALRLQVLQAIVASNPEVQQAIQNRPVLAQMLEQRAKYHQQQIMQQQNAVTGKTGGQPVLPQQVI